LRSLSTGLLVWGLAFAQPPPPQVRDALQEAYRNWRQTDPGLERDATSAGATLGARADKAAAEAAKYFAARKAYLDNLASDANRKASVIEAVNLAPETAAGLEAYLGAQRTILESSARTISRDSDPGIQPLLQAFDRERSALAALSAAIRDMRKTEDALASSSAAAEQGRAQTAEHYQKLAASFQQSAQLVEESGNAWAMYYRSLSSAARSAPAPVTSAAPVRAPNSAEAGTATVPNSAPAPSGPPPIPLSRYVGSWTYGIVGSNFHGVEPQLVEMELRSENGRIHGTLFARFKLPPGGPTDPIVRFSFEGPFENSRTQKFPITTSNGAPGIVELLPGPAFNLLEVNFSTYDKPGMVRQGNFLLMKK
jgi:hypothetical protein